MFRNDKINPKVAPSAGENNNYGSLWNAMSKLAIITQITGEY